MKTFIPLFVVRFLKWALDIKSPSKIWIDDAMQGIDLAKYELCRKIKNEGTTTEY